MFGLLKNKLSNFINGLAGREEKKPAAAPEEKPIEQPPKEPKEETRTAQKQAVVPEKKQPETISKPKAAPVAEKKIPERERKAAPKKEEPKAKPKTEDGAGEKPAQKKEEQLLQPKIKPAPQVEEKPPAPVPSMPAKPPAASVPEKKKSFFDIVAIQFSKKPEAAKEEAKKPEAKQIGQTKPEPIVKPAAKVQVPKPEPKPPVQVPGQKKPEVSVPAQPEHDLSGLERRAGAEKHHAIAPKIGIGTSIKSIFSSEITISEAEVSDLLEELELSLLEADVAYDVSIEVISQLRSSLVGMKVPKGEVGKRTASAIQSVLESVMDSDKKFDFMERVKSLPKPAKILFVGPNGAGKTTTMAKLAHLLIGSGLTVVFSASDTFRAAAIEQTEVHGGKLGVKVIKSKYGADPASVAFDAINYARANSVDVVLIDSAGRQDTNANLLSELVKINRIAKPDIKLYIGESIGGNSVIDQIRAFNESIGVDGAILTKIDCDAKGGTAISIAKSTGIPVLFLGVGQGYSDLIQFDPHKVASEIMG